MAMGSSAGGGAPPPDPRLQRGALAAAMASPSRPVAGIMAGSSPIARPDRMGMMAGGPPPRPDMASPENPVAGIMAGAPKGGRKPPAPRMTPPWVGREPQGGPGWGMQWPGRPQFTLPRSGSGLNRGGR